jgi:polynucleotide 5'-kinase involved in rRNA processing
VQISSDHQTKSSHLQEQLSSYHLPDDTSDLDLAVRLIVVGGRQVGKSALTVRYLTRRFIGEYQSFSGKKGTFQLEGDS